jgi:Domain of unknown function (DUF4062)/inactive STAND
MGTVYISSTYEDLREHRQAAFEAVRRVEHVPVGMEDYQASEQRPLDRCLQDVRRCNAYIGLIGWRYGHVPAGHTRSITALEYDEAGRRGIPRMIFMAPEKDWPAALRDADTARVAAFRKELRDAHLVNEFENIHDLRFKVATSLQRQVGEGVVIPPLLPYRCDRDDQYDDMAGGLDELARARTRAEASAARLIVLVHGRETQSLNMFVQCIREEAGQLCGAPQNLGVVWKELTWPTERSLDTFRAASMRAVARLVDAADRTPQAVAERIDQVAEPFVVHSRVYIDDWSAEQRLGLLAFVDFWHRLPLAPRQFPVLLLLTVEYREPGLLERLRGDRRNVAVRAALHEVAARYAAQPGLVLVRELDDVKRHHAEVWADSDRVRALLPGLDLRDEIAAVFQARERMPMRPLASGLLSILQKKTA